MRKAGRKLLIAADDMVEYLAGREMDISPEAQAEISGRLYGMLEIAILKARGSGRSVIRISDLPMGASNGPYAISTEDRDDFLGDRESDAESPREPPVRGR
jgi:hypothetical protein